jgi:uncharacterized protein (TIGR03083 family)
MGGSAPTAESVATWIVHLRRETERFAAVVSRSPLPAHVPAYPDFTVHSLAAHIGQGLRLFERILTGADTDAAIAVPDGPEVASWVIAGLGPLITVLQEVPPDKPVPFPHQAGDRAAGLIAPLLAVEIGVHRWDVESVLGEHQPIPSDLAVREVENVFANFVPRLAGHGVADIGGTVWLRTTDTAAAWSARVADGALVTEPAPNEPGDTAVTVDGAAQDIALLVWKRAVPPRAELTVTGSADVLKRFLVTDYIPDPRTTPAH